MRKGFTLLEMMVTVLLGGLITLIIAGGLRSAIRTWTSVQERVAENYNRRSVWDLVKRQTSSLFYKRDADSLSQAAEAPLSIQEQENFRRRRGSRIRVHRPRVSRGQTGAGFTRFELPPDTHFFKGNIQELSFLSTVSFLSDFPGQVAVRYYVVQGQPEEEDLLSDLPTSRSQDDSFANDPFGEPVDEVEEIAEELEGELYLYLEEKNLFLSAILEEGDIVSQANDLARPLEEADDFGDIGESLDDGEAVAEEGLSGVLSVNTMKLIGPFRKFSIRYRLPGIRRVEEADEEEDWVETWDLDQDGMYPSAVEFIAFYEQPGVTEDVATEELQGIRMVIPIYDTRNLVRGARNAPF